MEAQTGTFAVKVRVSVDCSQPVGMVFANNVVCWRSITRSPAHTATWCQQQQQRQQHHKKLQVTQQPLLLLSTALTRLNCLHAAIRRVFGWLAWWHAAFPQTTAAAGSHTIP
jgi:hypothetical protein